MPATFTQEPYVEKPKLLPKIKPGVFVPTLLGLTILYLIYYFTPSSITSLIPNPFTKKATITVLGTGSVKATPDTAQFAVTIASTGKDSNQALSNAKTKVNSLVDNLKTKGLADSDFQIAAYNVTSTTATGSLLYAAGTTILVTSPDLILAESLINSSLAAGARLSVPLTYTVNDTDRVTYEARARAEAVKNANTKAKNIAKSYSKQLGKMTAYTETPSTQGSLTESSTSTSQPGEIEITQTIQVSFKTK